MCGIAGAVALAEGVVPRPDLVREMSRCVAYRGPDGDGLWISPDGRAVLAHQRLAIIDLETGEQPQVSQSGETALILNGEIYNYRELRQELERDGCTFRTNSDTEVLLLLVEREGERAVERARGMFAFAAWDHRRKRLILARDRLGKKPLFWAVRDDICYFASALAAVRAACGGNVSVDLGALDEYLTLGWVPSPRTIFRDIHKLEPATVLVFERGQARSREFWDLAPEEPHYSGTFEEATDELAGILGRATSLRLRSDVPLGVFLSGGVDSSLVAALASREDRSIRTFTVRFREREFDESEHASAVAAQLGIAHQIVDAAGDPMEAFPGLLQKFGEPFADSSALPTALLASSARRHVTVALGGDGGDEGFGGYTWYGTFRAVQQMARFIPSDLARSAARWLEPTRLSAPLVRTRGRMARGLSVMGRRTDAARFAALRVLLTSDQVRCLYQGELLERRLAADSVHERAESLFNGTRGTALRRMRWVDMRTYLADCLLPKVDVATMAAGLEARAPLLDQEVIRFAMTLPDDYLVDDKGGKRILRALLSRYVPRRLFERPKQGFTPPLSRWLEMEWRDRVAALPRSEPLASLGVLRQDGIQRLVDEHALKVRDHTDRLYALLVLESWLDLGLAS